MTEGTLIASLISFAHISVQIGIIFRVMLKPYREPASRIAWVLVILVLPVAGIFAYLLLGEASIGRKRISRMRKVLRRLPAPESIGIKDNQPITLERVPEPLTHLFDLGKSINGFLPTHGNQACLLADSHDAIRSIVEDIDSARETVHLMFYIWLDDNSGRKVAEALCRAAQRGVICRAMADGLGSRGIIESATWKEMRKSGVQLARALPISPPPFGLLKGRIDLRNHRKIIVIDNRITYCGSQNCADPEFRIKEKYGPWVDLMVRFEGPIALQNQYLFAADWMNEVEEDLSPLLRQAPGQTAGGMSAIVIGTGPTIRFSAMPETFESLMYTARRELIITTPYFVPNESMLAALCASAHRGVDTTIIFPARNDSTFVAAASRSYYRYLLDAGVRIFEFTGGLLHTKSLTLDSEICLIGSANLDQRSFELNYENNILFHDSRLAGDIRQRQQEYIASSRQIILEEVDNWSWQKKLGNNVVGLLGPVL